MASLAEINSALNIGIAIGNLVIPGITAVVSDIKAALTSGGTVTYAVTLQITSDELQKLLGQEQADLAVINAELIRQGQAPV